MYDPFRSEKEADDAKAFSMYMKEANNGSHLAEANVGHCYETGNGTVRDTEKAFHWYLKAANGGEVKGQYNLAHAFMNGIGVEQNSKRAFFWYSKAAAAGFRDAQNNLGVCYYAGYGTEKDAQKSFYWWSKAAAQDTSKSLLNLGILYSNGDGVEKSVQLAAHYWELAAKRDSDLARKALELLTTMDDQADAGFCDYHMALYHRNGWGVPRDTEKEVCLLRSAARKGHIDATVELAEWHQREALRLYSKLQSPSEMSSRLHSHTAITISLGGWIQCISKYTRWPDELCILSLTYLF